MKYIALDAALTALTIASPSAARSYHYHYHSHAYHEYGPHYGRHYTNVSGDGVHSPMRLAGRPAGATAHCSDGSWSFSQHARGTCSHHGGVA